MSKQPRDDGNAPIPVLGYRKHGGYKVPFTTSANTSPQISAAVRVVSLYSTAAGFFETGDSGIEANTSNSHYIPASTFIDVSLGSENDASTLDKYISIVGISSGTLYISERR